MRLTSFAFLAFGSTFLTLETGCSAFHGGASLAARQRRSETAQAQLARDIEADIAILAPGAHVGVHALLVGDDHPWVMLRSEERFVPASVLKMYTAAAALSLLGPAHRIQTVFGTDRFEHNGRKIHNLYVRGEGDPTLGVGDISRVAQAIAQLGIERITGDLIVDNTAFDNVPYGQGWMWDDLTEGYSAPIAATGVQESALTVQVLPGLHPGQPVRLITEPATRFVQLLSHAVTGPQGSPHLLTITTDARLPEAPLSEGGNLLIEGSLPLNASFVLRNLAVADPAAYTATLLREHLQRAGVAAPESVHVGAMPQTATLLSTHHSPPLSAIVQSALKASDNYAIEVLLKHLGFATDPTAPGSWMTGLRAVRRFVSEAVGPEAARSSLVDGSGVSRYSLVAPHQMTALLRQMYMSFSAGPEFVSALPIAGLDGTLSRRFKEEGALGQVRAKTGSMRGIGALSGYARTWDGEIVAFAILADDFMGSRDALRALHERIVARLIAYPQGFEAAPPEGRAPASPVS